MFLRCSIVGVVLFVTLSCYTHALIVPQELPSILSLVYSNIPPIRKGTDSRLGFGFRLGEHADFQVVVELGPQKETRPLTNPDSSSSSKRQVNRNDYQRVRPSPEESSTVASSWLQNWSNDMHAKKRKASTSSKVKLQNTENLSMQNGYIKTVPMMSESTLKQLQKLYKMATTTNSPIVVEDNTASADERQPVDMLSIISPRHASQSQSKTRRTKGEITDDLMDVKME